MYIKLKYNMKKLLRLICQPNLLKYTKFFKQAVIPIFYACIRRCIVIYYMCILCHFWHIDFNKIS